MNLRRLVFSAFAASLFFFLSTAMAAPTPAPAGNEDIMAKFMGSTKGNANGSECTIVGLQLLNGSKNVQIAVPNETPRAAVKGAPPSAPTPKKDIIAVVNKLKPGTSIIKFTAESAKSGPMPQFVTIEEYDAKPGEDTPNGYVYAKTYDKPLGKITLTLVVLTKFGVEHPFKLPMKKNDKGEQEQDPELVAQLAKIPIGSAVWISSKGLGANAELTAIEPYVDPQIGKITKFSDMEIEGHKVPTAEIEVEGGKSVTVIVPLITKGKVSAPDTAIAASLRKFKVNSQVAFRTHEDGDKLWLREITVAPKVTAAAPDKKMDAPATPKKPAK